MSRVMPKFRLYVAGGTSNSVQAIANFKVLCAQHLSKGYELEIVDVLREPKRALSDGILMTPTLVKIAPAPMTRIIGTLNQAQATTLHALGL